MPRCSGAGLDFRIIPAWFNALLEFLTGFTTKLLPSLGGRGYLQYSPSEEERK